MNNYERLIEVGNSIEGPQSVIMAGVHGHERAGIEAFELILPTLKIERGRVLFVYGNPRAIGENKRFTEADLNRMFVSDDELSSKDKESYEYGRAQELKPILRQAEVLLDLHGTNNPNSEVFAIGESNGREIVEQLLVEIFVTGLDPIQPGGTDYFMNMEGNVGICMECGYNKDIESTGRAKEAILAFLGAREHIERERVANEKPLTVIRVFSMYRTISEDYKMAEPFPEFADLEPGRLIGVDGGIDVRAERQSVILFASTLEIKNRGQEAFVLAEHSQ